MADLRVKSTGREFRRVDNATALLLEELFPENLERINAPAAAPMHPDNTVNKLIPNHVVPVWEIALDLAQKPYIQLLIGSTEYIYAGSPDGAKAHFGRVGFAVPENIIDRWRRLYKYDGPILPGAAEAVAANLRHATDLEFARQLQRENAAGLAEAPGGTGTFGVAPMTLEPFPKK